MRVLVFTNMWPIADDPSAGCFVAEQVDDLRSLGIDVDVLAFNGRDDSRNYVRGARALRRRLSADAFDLVHAHYGLTGAAALLQQRAPIVTTFHGSDTGYVPWQRHVSRFVARATTPIFVNADGARRLAIRTPRVIPIGVDLASFNSMPRDVARRTLGWRLDGVYVLFPSNPAKRVKRVELFDLAMQELVAAGVEATPVYLTGFSRQEVRLVLNAVDVVLLTSWSEGSPVVVKEALACQTAVVSVDVGDVRLILRDLPGCHVCEPNPASLMLAVRDALECRGSNLLRKRAEQYARIEMAKRIADVYSDVLSERSDR